MKQNKSYKLRIYPNKTQEELINKTFGSNRFIWNIVLDYKQKLYSSRKKFYGKYDSIKDIKLIKDLPDFSFLKEIDSVSLQQTLLNLDQAYQNFFRKLKQRQKTSIKFKSKHNKQTYRTLNNNNSIKISDKTIKLPKLGHIRFKDKREIKEKIKSATVSKTLTGKYFCSVLVEYNFEPNKPLVIDKSKVFSADMSAKQFMVSEEMEFENQKFYRTNERKLRIKHRRLSRKQKGSNNRQKQKRSLVSFYEQITNKRKGFQKNLFTDLFPSLMFSVLKI